MRRIFSSEDARPCDLSSPCVMILLADLFPWGKLRDLTLGGFPAQQSRDSGSCDCLGLPK